MSCKRKGKTNQKFYCPYCQQRLWRLGSSKYYLLSQRRAASQSSRLSDFSASQNFVCANRSFWLEEFYCEEHGELWMLLSKAFDGRFAIASILNLLCSISSQR